MKRTVLIVEAKDSEQERLRSILSENYICLEAENCTLALRILLHGNNVVSAILLDMTTVTDSDQLLLSLRQNEPLAQLPLLAILDANEKDAQSKALSLGAVSCLNKPYDSELLRTLLQNILRLHEAAACVHQRDPLTGLLNREAFFAQAKRMIRGHSPGHYVLSCLNIVSFKVINNQYGEAIGDEVLRHVGNCFDKCLNPLGGICCRYMADKFAILYPAEYMHSGTILQCHKNVQEPDCINHSIQIRIGRCMVDDISVFVGNLYDRAVIAEETLRGRYDVYIAEYRASMRDQLLYEQRIISQMHEALRKGQFETWFQPLYNHATGALIGAEALVRWRHPTDGLLISPGRFIPVFERNGFIYELDQYIWAQVCATLRRWLDEGRSPLPISVNVSRIDVLMKDFIEVLTGLVQKYEIPISLLRLEITESAFAKSTTQIVFTIKKLIALGFTVEIDDFGSGYSSLNTLKDVPAHIVKLDMRFLENTEDSQRGGNILESVIRMAKWLDMSVIAEGVETIEQADYLKSIGCFFVQGYLYAKPMPIHEYEVLEAAAEKQPALETLKTVKNLNTNSFWDPRSMDTLIFNSYLGGACILEVYNGKIEMLRANDKYIQVIGSAGMKMADALKLDWAAHMDDEGRQHFFQALQYSLETGDESDDEHLFYHLPGCAEKTYLRVSLRVIAASGDRLLVYCLIENTTPLRLAELREQETMLKMAAILENVNGGVSAVTSADVENSQYVFANNQFYDMLGYSKGQFEAELPTGILGLIHPEDLPQVIAIARQKLRVGNPAHIEYRVQRRDGSWIWVESHCSVTQIDKTGTPLYISVTVDVTDQKESEEHFRFLNEMSRKILSQRDTEASINAILHSLLDFFHSDRAYVFELDVDKNEINNTYEACVEAIPQELDNLQSIPAFSMRFWLEALERQDYVDIRNFEVLALERPSKTYLDTHHIHSIVAVPLRRDGRIIGFIGLDNTRQNHSHLGRLVALGDYLAVMLTRRDDERRVNSHTQALEQMMQDIPGGYAQMKVTQTGLAPIFINNELCRLCGVTHQQAIELYAQDPYSAVHPDDVDMVRSVMREAIESKSTGFLHVRLTYGCGGYVPMQVFYRVTGDADGQVYVNGYYSDSTERNKKEAQRRELLDNLPAGAALYAYDGETLSVVHLSRHYWELVGRKPAQYKAENFLHAVHPEDQAAIFNVLREAIRDNRNFDYNIRILYGEDEYRPFRLAAKIAAQDDGNYLIYATYTPITEHELHCRDMLPAALTAMMHASSDYLFVKDRDLRYVCANLATSRWLGAQSEAELKGKTNHDLMDQTLADQYAQYEWQVLKSGEAMMGLEEMVPSAGGLPSWSAVSKYPLRNEAGGIIGLLGIGRDVTDIHDAAFELETLLRFIPSGVFKYAAGAEEKFAYISKSFMTRLGYTEKQFRTKFNNCFREMVYAEDRDRVKREIIEQESGGGIGRFDYRIETADGHLRWFHNEGARVTDREGKTWYYVTVTDITGQREADAKLRLLANGVSGGLGSFEYSRSGGLRELYMNEGLFRLLGYTKEEYTTLTAENLLALVFDEDRKSILEVFSSIGQEDWRSASCTFRGRKKDGGACWLSLRIDLSERHGDTAVFNLVFYDITEQKKVEQQLRMSEEAYRLAALHSNVSIGRYSIADKTLSIAVRSEENSSFPEVLKDVPHGPVKSGDVSSNTVSAYEDFYERIQRGEKAGTAKYQRRIDQQWHWVEAHFSTLFSDDGKPVSAILSFREVTEQIEQAAVYKKWIQSLQDRPESSYTLVQCNLSKNASFDSAEGSLLEPSFPIPDPETFSNRLRHYAAKHIYVNDRKNYTDALSIKALCAAYSSGKHITVLEFREIVPKGGVRWLQLTVELVEHPGSSDIIAYMLYEDIDKHKREELQTQSLAQSDPLTGLLNRSAFKESVETGLRQREKDCMCALFMMDVDGFKSVNDSLGHMAGDQMLIRIGQELRSILRKEDLICRIGGDEFTVFLCSVPNRDIIEKKAEQICSLIQASIGPEHNITISLGISVVPNDGDTFEMLYQKADNALYHVKTTGKNYYAFYSLPEHMEQTASPEIY